MNKIIDNIKSGNYEVVDNQGVSVTRHFTQCLEKEFADLEAKLAEAQKPKEIRFNGFVVDCNYDEARKVLQEDLLKMQAENNKLKESEELSNYAKCILENKKLEEDLELSEKCCVEYEQEIQELKQQLAEKTLTIEQINKAFIENRSLWKGKYEQSNQDKISFAVDILEELAGCSNYINSKLDFECGSYVSEKAIRDKIKYLKGKKYE